MRPIIISKTVQEFGGKRFYRCGAYFQNKGVRLHREVWEFHNGKIPEASHIHHLDGDRSNNAPQNLECLSVLAHLGERHGEDSAERGRGALEDARKLAAVWHGSSAGRQWHSEHFERHIRPVMDRRVSAVCEQCGAEYMVSAARVAQGRFCGGNCRASALRKRRADAKRASLLSE